MLIARIKPFITFKQDHFQVIWRSLDFFVAIYPSQRHILPPLLGDGGGGGGGRVRRQLDLFGDLITVVVGKYNELSEGGHSTCCWTLWRAAGQPWQSRKNPVSATAMLTGKFLQIRKVFATSSLLAEEYPDTLRYKISR